VEQWLRPVQCPDTSLTALSTCGCGNMHAMAKAFDLSLLLPPLLFLLLLLLL
jgi:hypothetical protein